MVICRVQMPEMEINAENDNIYNRTTMLANSGYYLRTRVVKNLFKNLEQNEDYCENT